MEWNADVHWCMGPPAGSGLQFLGRVCNSDDSGVALPLKAAAPVATTILLQACVAICGRLPVVVIGSIERLFGERTGNDISHGSCCGSCGNTLALCTKELCAEGREGLDVSRRAQRGA